MLLQESPHGGALACLRMAGGSAKVVSLTPPAEGNVEVWLHVVRSADGRRRVYAATVDNQQPVQYRGWAAECNLPGGVGEVVRALARTVETGEAVEYNDAAVSRRVLSYGFPFPPPEGAGR